MTSGENDAEELIAVNHGGRTYYAKKTLNTLDDRIAYLRSVDLRMTRLQLTEHADSRERTLIRIEQSEVTKLLLPSALAIEEPLGVPLDWFCGSI